MKELELPLRWKPMESIAGQKYFYPGERTPHIEQQLNRAGIYRWAIFEPTDTLAAGTQEPFEAYIGQSELLLIRWGAYLRQGKNKWKAAHLLKRAEEGKRIEYQTLEFESFRINNIAFSVSSLDEQFHRVVLEHMALACSPDGCRILNKKSDLREKQIQRAVKELEALKVTPEQLVQTVAKLTAKGS